MMGTGMFQYLFDFGILHENRIDAHGLDGLDRPVVCNGPPGNLRRAAVSYQLHIFY